MAAPTALIGFFDESGKDDGGRVFTLAGFVGEPRRWPQFERSWKVVLKHAGIEALPHATLRAPARQPRVGQPACARRDVEGQTKGGASHAKDSWRGIGGGARDRAAHRQPGRAREEGESMPRAIADYVAGMTDRFALQEYKRLFDPEERAAVRSDGRRGRTHVELWLSLRELR